MTAAQCWGEGSRVRDLRHWGKDARLPLLRHGVGGGEQQGLRLRHWGKMSLFRDLTPRHWSKDAQDPWLRHRAGQGEAGALWSAAQGRGRGAWSAIRGTGEGEHRLQVVGGSSGDRRNCFSVQMVLRQEDPCGSEKRWRGQVVAGQSAFESRWFGDCVGAGGYTTGPWEGPQERRGSARVWPSCGGVCGSGSVEWSSARGRGGNGPLWTTRPPFPGWFFLIFLSLLISSVLCLYWFLL